MHFDELPQFCGNFDKQEIAMASKRLIIPIGYSIEGISSSSSMASKVP